MNDTLLPLYRITIVTPVYNETESLPHYEKVVRETLMNQPGYDVRVLFVDDGSRDRSWEMIEQLARRDERFQGLRLSRNFGAHLAVSAGFEHVQDSDAVVVLACDLQDPAEVVLEFLSKWHNGAQIVWGHRRTRDDSLWRIAASRLFFFMLRRFAMPRGSKFTTGGFLLADRRVVQCFCEFPERNRIVFALVAWTGFEQAIVEYDRVRRAHGKSAWSPARMFKTMYDAFIGFSNVPVRVMTTLGMCTSLLAGGLSLYVLFGWLTGTPRPGWTSLMLIHSVFFGLQFFLMGVTGEYLYRIYAEVTRRPLYFVSASTPQSLPQSRNGFTPGCEVARSRAEHEVMQ